MNTPHRQVITDHPIALKAGQQRLHLAKPIPPWHAQCEQVQCPGCETVYIMTTGFPREQLLAALDGQHKNHEEHPDLIPFAPDWTTITECDCSS